MLENAKERICVEAGCGRPAYARGYCQTHNQQLLKTGRTRPIRPYRQRGPGTVKFVGLRVSQACADKVSRYAERKHLAVGAAIAELLEQWAARTKP